VDRLQVAVLVSLPHRRRVRRASYLPAEKERGSTDAPSLPPEQGSDRKVGEGLETEDHDSPASPDKGKKRSLETPMSHLHDLKGHCDGYDEDDPMEVAFGTVILPFEEEEVVQTKG